MQPNKIQPAVIGGVILGLLSSIPFVNLGNLCCCLWVVGGGALASYLYIKKSETPVSVGEGAIVGLIAGLVGAFVGLVIGLPLSLLTGNVMMDAVGKMFESLDPNAARQFQAQIEQYKNMSVGERLVQSIPGVLLNFAVTAAMATVGGLLGVVLLEKRKPLQGMPPVPPPDFGNMPR